jgi:ubiquinol-cytochrome c reductase iron-sulfur subunit
MAAIDQSSDHDEDVNRRDFLYVAAGVASAVGAAFAAWPLVNSMNPAANVLALATTEVDLSPIAVGQSVTVVWRGKPVFIRHRTQDEIDQALADDKTDLPDWEADADRAPRSEWLIVIGICTHLGCIPLGQKTGERRGDFGGWFCPCHGSHYDTAARIRKGPAPRNLELPRYSYLDDTTVRIG